MNLPSSSANLQSRHSQGKIWQAFFFACTFTGILALTLLMATIINQAFGLVAVQNKVEPAALSERPLQDLSPVQLAELLKTKMKPTRYRTLEEQRPMLERSQAELYRLVMEQLVQPQVMDSYLLFDSLFNRALIEHEALASYPQAHLEWRAWISPEFLSDTASATPEKAGVRTALLGSLWVILVTVGVAFPIGVGAAIYLEEYAAPNRLNRLIQTNINNLAGVPSIVYGLLGLAIFVRAFSPLTSGAVFGSAAVNGRTILSAGLTMALLVLPILIINAQEAIRAVPQSLRQASYGLGATRWQTIWSHVLPAALPGILTGAILSVSRAIGETAPLIIVGASTFMDKDPSSLFSTFTVLPIQIYNWTTRPQGEFHNIAAAAILVLMMTLLSLNASAILLRNRFSKR